MYQFNGEDQIVCVCVCIHHQNQRVQYTPKFPSILVLLTYILLYSVWVGCWRHPKHWNTWKLHTSECRLINSIPTVSEFADSTTFRWQIYRESKWHLYRPDRTALPPGVRDKWASIHPFLFTVSENILNRDRLWYNKKCLVFVSASWYKAAKNLGISWETRVSLVC